MAMLKNKQAKSANVISTIVVDFEYPYSINKKNNLHS